MRAMSEHEDRAETTTVVLAVIGIGTVILFLREWKRTTPPATWVFVFLLVAMIIASAAVAWTGAEGGLIRHSEVRPVETAGNP
jgi:uncharacterized protein (DUF983 family)